MPRALATPSRPKPDHAGRNKILVQALQAIVILRSGRWTMFDLAAELGVHWRTAYRIVDGLRAAGVTVEVSVERQGRQKDGHYTVPASGLRKLLKL